MAIKFIFATFILFTLAYSYQPKSFSLRDQVLTADIIIKAKALNDTKPKIKLTKLDSIVGGYETTNDFLIQEWITDSLKINSISLNYSTWQAVFKKDTIYIIFIKKVKNKYTLINMGSGVYLFNKILSQGGMDNFMEYNYDDFVNRIKDIIKSNRKSGNSK
jgi:hypothetical protein